MTSRPDALPPDYYARLGVQPSASAEAIREAYRKKARETHPDLNPNDPNAAEQFREVQKAYRILHDPERREAYDEARAGHQSPEVLTINQRAPAGCQGYLWRVLAGGVAVAVFFVLEALGVWAAGTWAVLLAIGGAALVAGLISVVVADWFPTEATDVTLRLDPQWIAMWADGRSILRLSWKQVETVRLRDDGWTLELGVRPQAGQGLAPVPPVLVSVRRGREWRNLQFDLSDTDVRRSALVEFLQSADAIPSPERTSPHS